MLWVDKKYLRLISSRFRNSKWKDDNLLNHSCPYCGDSKKKKTKTTTKRKAKAKVGSTQDAFEKAKKSK